MKRKLLLLCVLCVFFTAGSFAADESLKLHYSFVSGVNDITGNGYNGTLKNGATVCILGEFSVLNLGSSNGYLDMGSKTGELISSLEDFSISTCLYLDLSTSISGDGNFVWTFSTSSSCGQSSGKYIAYRVNRQRYTQSSGGWGSEVVAVEKGAAASKGSWQHVIYTQSGASGKLYVNGQLIASGAASLNPEKIGSPTLYNWIGRPQFSGDAYLKNALIADFRIYNRALSASEITGLSALAVKLNEAQAVVDMSAAITGLNLGNLNEVRKNMVLPSLIGNNVNVAWQSSVPAIISNDGVVIRPPYGSQNARVMLTATFTKDGKKDVRNYAATVLSKVSDAEAVNRDANDLVIPAKHCYRQHLVLPSNSVEGSTITWKSDRPEYLSDAGKLIRLPSKGSGNVEVKLTAEIKKGAVSSTKKFTVCIAEDEGYSGYLFAYFTGNSGLEESIRFAVSSDGYTYKALNANLPVIGSDTISDMGGVRDPHILRGADGKTFYMVVTDMKSALGWSSNHGIILLKSTDLVNWTSGKVDIRTRFPKTPFNKTDRAWAPQTIYDRETGKYMIYFSLRFGSGADVIYYAYANDDFTDLATEPKILFNHPLGKSCIDGDIIYKDGKYNLFFKTEGDGNGIKKAISDKLTEGYVVLQDKYLQPTTEAVEGSCVFRLINSDQYILMYDVYAAGKYQFTESADLENFTVIDSEISMNFTPRHGTVMPISSEEAVRLMNKWGKESLLRIDKTGSDAVKKNNIVLDETAKTYYLPVRYGVDIQYFDPQITSLPGIKISPKGTQDFSKGAVAYTLRAGEYSQVYNVEVQVNNNPVLEGYYADPDILYAEKTGKFYLYPTADGFTGWSGDYFKVFSSGDMVSWKDEGVIIDLPKDVTWADGNAWAPCIVEKKINGEYKYFYYFTARQKIGVAVADNPTGPFRDSGKALINFKPAGVKGGQEIDPDVFTDPKTGKSYLYWGNGYMAGAELNDDMVSIDKNTIRVMTPNDTFREGAYVIYRHGTYYFFWSEDDTRSPNYKVRYGTSDSPLGNITVPANNLVIQKDAEKGIYGTGHNSVIQIPGTDHWYIVYHRFTRPNGINMGDAAGYNREVCIDQLEFNADGSVKQVQPTVEGISPVFVPSR